MHLRKKAAKATAQRKPRYDEAGEEILVDVDPADFLVEGSEDGDEGRRGVLEQD
jgi:hypothetical protein